MAEILLKVALNTKISNEIKCTNAEKKILLKVLRPFHYKVCLSCTLC